ncbi:MAG TPA: hypothetical protein DEB40_06125 [Elusimicrobia bacterium]|nr:hypothetical protein [Elusimicrobiota bacterium]HBT61304.1 hypothetical protein [Elusimicrobiota bacterium]
MSLLPTLLLPFLLAQAQAVPGRLVVVNDVTDPVSLDPHREFDASSDNIVNQIFDGLVRLDPQGRIIPGLAESWRRVDELTMEFSLRRNVSFHNGEPFNAEAVKFSLKRQLDARHPAPNAGLIRSILSVDIVDEHTVRLKTKEPDGILLNKLPMFFKIVPPRYIAQVGDDGFALHPMGTGPFRFIRWDHGREIEIEANPSYWMPGAPRVQRLIFRFLPMNRQLDALLAGEVDMITDLSGLDTMKVVRNPDTKILKSADLYAVTLIPNSRRGPFADLRVRQALPYAIDAGALIRYAAKGNGRRLSTLSAPGQFGHNPQIRSPEANPRKAASLLRAAGFNKGPKIRMLVREEILQFGLVIAAQLRRVGMEVDMRTASQEQVFQEVVRPNLDASLPPWEGDLLVSHFVDPTAHSYFPYMIFVHSQGPYSLARDADFDALFERMIRTLNSQEQEKVCFRLAELVQNKGLAYSPVQVIRSFALRRKLHYEPQIAGMLDFRTAGWEEP